MHGAFRLALAVQVAIASERSEGLSEKAEKLADALQRLQASRARLAVLEAALGDTRAIMTAFRFFVPRK